MHIQTEIHIEAQPEEVWSALTDIASYRDWNPYHVSVRSEGDLAPGVRLTVEIDKPNGERLTIRPRVLRMEADRELTWGGGPRGIFHGEHTFVLEPSGNGTRLVHSEVFKGLAVRFASLGSIEDGYNLMNRALKDYVESGTVIVDLSEPGRAFRFDQPASLKNEGILD